MTAILYIPALIQDCVQKKNISEEAKQRMTRTLLKESFSL